jgi:hypothetical protein
MATKQFVPRDLALDGKNHEKFKDLIESSLARALSPFYKRTMKEVFMYAMGIGFINGRRLKLQKKIGTIPTTTLDDRDEALIEAAAVTEKGSLDILHKENIKEAYEIAEEYANGGITDLYSMVFGEEPGDPDRRMEQNLREAFEKEGNVSSAQPNVESSGILLKNFESELRSFIQRELEENVGKDWWKKAVPPDVQQKCKERKDSREKLPWLEMGDNAEIFYADFADYFKIISRRDHWKNIFAKFFADEAWIKTKLVLELLPIRNDIAHNRDLTPESAQKLELATQEIVRCIKKAK